MCPAAFLLAADPCSCYPEALPVQGPGLATSEGAFCEVNFVLEPSAAAAAKPTAAAEPAAAAAKPTAAAEPAAAAKKRGDEATCMPSCLRRLLLASRLRTWLAGKLRSRMPAGQQPHHSETAAGRSSPAQDPAIPPTNLSRPVHAASSSSSLGTAAGRGRCQPLLAAPKPPSTGCGSC